MTMANLFVVTLLIACAILSVSGHGYMSNPAPRGQYTDPKLMVHQEYEPTGTSPNDQRFICRTDTPMPPANYLAIRAGDSVPITLFWNAPHPGSCAVYLTHDGDKPYSQMKWYKIWDTTNCIKATSYNIPIPSYIPSASHAIFRWEWYGLHVMNAGNGAVEYYSQCVDASIQGQAGGVLPQPQVNIPGHMPVIRPGNYWDPYNNAGPSTEFVTGPQVATRDGTPNPTITATTSATTATSATSNSPTSNSATSRTATSNAGTSGTPSATSGNTNPTSGTPSDTTSTTCTPGTVRCPCIGSGNACNQGLTCASGLCVSIDDVSKIGAASTPAILVFVSVACILLSLL